MRANGDIAIQLMLTRRLVCVRLSVRESNSACQVLINAVTVQVPSAIPDVWLPTLDSHEFARVPNHDQSRFFVLYFQYDQSLTAFELILS